MSDDVLARSHFQQRGRLDYHLAVYDECGIYPTIIYGYLERWVWIGSKTGKGAFPSHETLSKQSGISVRSVVAALNELREKGWIDWTRTGSSNRYVLTDKIGRSAPDAERDESSARNDAQDVQNRSAPDADELLRANTLSSSPLSPTETSPRGEYTSEFEAWWVIYPRNGGSKSAAFRTWQRMKPEQREAARIEIRRWIVCDQWQEGVIPHAVTWLNQKRWEVDPPPPRSRNVIEPKRNRAEEIMEAAARVQARHNERDRNRANGDPHRIGIRSEDETSGYAAGTVGGSVGDEPSGHPVEAAWRERP